MDTASENDIPLAPDPNGPKQALPQIGDMLGGCRLTEVIGQGAMSVVYLAFEVDLEVKRAIKILKPGLSAGIRRKFDNEGKICAQLDHPNIVGVHGSGISPTGLPFIKMEYIEGKSLRQMLQAYRTLHPALCLAIISFICKALDYAKKQKYSLWGTTSEGVVHKDIKPENIMISSSGAVKLMDFGVALTSGEKTAAPFGTIYYMSPEQHDNGVVAHSSDIFSLGVVLYEMICGVRPFEGEIETVVAKKLSGNYEPVSEHAGAAGQEISDIISRCLNPAPNKRYTVYESLHFACEKALRKITSIPDAEIVSKFVQDPKNFKVLVYQGSHRNGKPKIKTPLLIGAIAAALVLIGIGLWTLGSRSQRSEVSSEQQKGNQSPAEINPQKIDSALFRPDSAASPLPAPAPQKNPAPIIKIEPQSKPSPIADALAQYHAKEYDKVITSLSDRIDTMPANSRKDSACIMLLESYYMTGAFNKAVALSRKVDLKDARYMMVLGSVWDALENSKQASECFDRAVILRSIMGETVRAEAVLQRARFYKRQFELSQSPELRSKLLSAWQDAESVLCPGDPKACSEAREAIKQYEK